MSVRNTSLGWLMTSLLYLLLWHFFLISDFTSSVKTGLLKTPLHPTHKWWNNRIKKETAFCSTEIWWTFHISRIFTLVPQTSPPQSLFSKQLRNLSMVSICTKTLDSANGNECVESRSDGHTLNNYPYIGPKLDRSNIYYTYTIHIQHILFIMYFNIWNIIQVLTSSTYMIINLKELRNDTHGNHLVAQTSAISQTHKTHRGGLDLCPVALSVIPNFFGTCYNPAVSDSFNVILTAKSEIFIHFKVNT